MRNDTGLPVKKVMDYLEKHGVDLKYGDHTLRIEKSALEKTKSHVANLSPEERQATMQSVDAALRTALPKIKKGKFSKRLMDNFCADLLLWEALKPDRS